jgi:hypothetical protein
LREHSLKRQPGTAVIRLFENFRVLLLKFIDVNTFNIEKESARDNSRGVLRNRFTRCDGVDGAAPVQFTGYDSVIPGAWST